METPTLNNSTRPTLMPLPEDTAVDSARARKLQSLQTAESSQSLAMLEAPLAATASEATTTDPIVNFQLTLQISVRRGRLALLVGVATVSVVLLTLFMSRGKELTRFDRHNVDAKEEKNLLDRYNSYSGTVASALGRPLEIFVTMMAQLLVLWLMTDSVMAFQTKWRVRLTVLALGAGMGFLLTSSLNALNVQVRPLPPRLIILKTDLKTPTNIFDSSTVENSFPEGSTRNPSANTILRNLILPRASIKAKCNASWDSIQDDSVTYDMPQRAWMKNFISTALPASTIRVDLLKNNTNGTANNFPTNASIIADLLVSAVYTKSNYAPFDAVTPFNLDGDPQKNTSWYPLDANNVSIIPTARLAGLLPPDPQANEVQDRAWLLAHTTEYMQRATSDDWQNNSTLLRWTLDVARVNITPNVWVDAVTIESEVLIGNRTVDGASAIGEVGTTTGLQTFSADNRYPDAQIHGFAVCLNSKGTDTLSSTASHNYYRNDSKAESRIDCDGRSSTSMHVFSTGRHFVADGMDYGKVNSSSEGGNVKLFASARNLRIVYSVTFARISWKLQNLSAVYNAACHVDGGCIGLDADLEPSSAEDLAGSGRNQRLLVHKNALPLDELTPVKYTREDAEMVNIPSQQPRQLVLVHRPTKVTNAIFAFAPTEVFRAKDKDLEVRTGASTEAQPSSWLGDVLLPHNLAFTITGSKTEWSVAQEQNCSSAFDRRILNYVNNHIYMETTLQPTYTAAAFYLFQNGVARDVLPQTATASKTVALQFDGNIQEMSVWLSVPKLNATLTLIGCVLLVMALIVALARLHFMTATQDHNVIVTTPHQIARVMVDDTTFPSLLLKRHIHDNGVTDDADQFVIHDVAVRSVKDVDASERV